MKEIEKHPKSPRSARWLLRKLQVEGNRDTLAGDFEEMYREIVDEKGTANAHIWYWLQIIQSLPAFIKNSLLWGSVMFKNYMKVTFRNIASHRVYSLINILGLSLGMACTILSLLLIQYENSYDDFHRKADQVYRIATSIKGDMDFGDAPITPAPLAAVLIDELPGIDRACRLELITDKGKKLFASGNQRFFQDHFFLADSNFFKLFDFNFIYGNPDSALISQNSLVLTESSAIKFFGDKNPLGQIVSYENRIDMVVSAVVKDPPSNTHLNFSLIGSFEILNDVRSFNYDNRWTSWNFMTYVLLQANVTPGQIEAALPGLLKKHMKAENQRYTLYLQPLRKIHTNPLQRYEIGRPLNTQLFIPLSLLGFLVLLIACLNFANLAATQSLKRNLEIGVRRVFGAQKKHIRSQFLGESVIISCISLVFALTFSRLFFPFFRNVADISSEWVFHLNPTMIIVILGLPILVGILSGTYPGFFAASFQPIKILQKSLSITSKGFSLKNFFLILQFTASTFLICCTLIISGQIHYIKNKDLGFRPERIVVLNMNWEMAGKYSVIKNELAAIPGVESVSGFDNLATDQGNYQGVHWEGLTEERDEMMRWAAVDYDYIEMMDLQLVQGRNFSHNYPADANGAYILTESAVKHIGWREPIGKRFNVKARGIGEGRVIGVIKDFHYSSFHNNIEPYYLFLKPDWSRHIGVKISASEIGAVMARIREAWEKVYPIQPMEFNLYSDVLDTLYASDSRLETGIRYFSILAILLAAMGLFGLTTFDVESRTKEIGIRKVFGAPVANLLTISVNRYLKIVLVSSFVAWPAVFYVMNRWLESYVYRAGIGVWPFLISLVLVTALATTILISRTFKTALANPVDTLRYE